jgi:hypothetical protein
MIYVNKRVQTQQLQVESSDITAITMKGERHVLLIISIYILYDRVAAECKRLLENSLDIVQRTLNELQQQGTEVRLIPVGIYTEGFYGSGGSDGSDFTAYGALRWNPP